MRKILSVCLFLCLMTVLSLTVSAQQFEPDQRGSISIEVTAQEEMPPMAGAEWSVFHVATAETDENGALLYTYTDAFSACGVDFDDSNLLSKLDDFVSAQTVPSQKIVTDAQGKAVCEDLPLGLYLVKQTGAAEGFALCQPFLIAVPMETEDGYLYDVNATPKIDVERLVSVTVKKVWNTDASTTIPGSVTVQLLDHDKVVQSAVLNEENHWQMTYDNLPESDEYRIEEVNIPAGFTATYTQKGYEFTVTNTASLAQTGQLMWPIPVLAAAGVFFLLLGFAFLRKSEKKDA